MTSRESSQALKVSTTWARTMNFAPRATWSNGCSTNCEADIGTARARSTAARANDLRTIHILLCIEIDACVALLQAVSHAAETEKKSVKWLMQCVLRDEAGKRPWINRCAHAQRLTHGEVSKVTLRCGGQAILPVPHGQAGS